MEFASPDDLAHAKSHRALAALWKMCSAGLPAEQLRLEIDNPVISQNQDVFNVARKVKAPGEKPLFWIGSSREDLLGFSEPVRNDLGLASSVAQYGGKHPNAKPWKGEGTGVLEVVENYQADTFSGFSVERLIHFLNALGRDVEIVIRKTRSSRTGRTLVIAA